MACPIGQGGHNKIIVGTDKHGPILLISRICSLYIYAAGSLVSLYRCCLWLITCGQCNFNVNHIRRIPLKLLKISVIDQHSALGKSVPDQYFWLIFRETTLYCVKSSMTIICHDQLLWQVFMRKWKHVCTLQLQLQAQRVCIIRQMAAPFSVHRHSSRSPSLTKLKIDQTKY